MKKIIIALLLFSLVAAPSYAESNKKAKQFFNNLANVLNNIASSKKLEKEHSRFEEQRKKLEADYQSGKISTEGYYNALAQIDKNQLEWEKAVSQTAIQQQQTNIQQQKVNIQRQEANRPIILTPNKKSSTITDRSGNVVGYVDD